MDEDELGKYLNISAEEIRRELHLLVQRPEVALGKRQVPFLPIETLLTYGLFFLMDPHRYGGSNIHTIPPAAAKLAVFFKRTPGSITNKMLNLEGFRANGAKLEPALFACLALEPSRFVALYHEIIRMARDLNIGEDVLPDFLELSSLLIGEGQVAAFPLTKGGLEPMESLLFGQEELPYSATELLAGKDKEEQLNLIEKSFGLTELLTEKIVEQKVRLAQHRFAREVLENCRFTCVFCGFTVSTGIQTKSGLLRASHIKPWAVSSNHERVDLQNGLTACPMHDAAFDQGYLMVTGGYKIRRAKVLDQGIMSNEATRRYFGDDLIDMSLRLPASAKRPKQSYLEYHRKNIYKDT